MENRYIAVTRDFDLRILTETYCPSLLSAQRMCNKKTTSQTNWQEVWKVIPERERRICIIARRYGFGEKKWIKTDLFNE